MPKQKLKVCVVGCGCAGLVTIKELLDEGHDVVCYEKDREEGGNFKAGTQSYASLRLTITQKTMCFSSMPSPATEPPAYWSRPQYYAYLRRFAEKFDLLAHVRFNCEVKKIVAGADSKYDVHVEGEQGPVVETFDAVAICQGPHRPARPRLPQIDGADEFRGIMLHSAEYRNVELVKGKKVVCIGFGESAGDIVAEMAGAAEECWVTFRRWPSLAMRWDDSGLSSDAFSIRASQKLPAKLRNVIARRQMAVAARSANPRVSLVAKWNLKCEHHMHKFLQKNDDFVPKVLDGTLKVHVGDIKRLTSHSVVFADGKEIEADMIVYCTGYSEGAPPDLIEGVSVTNVRDMFKHSIHPDLGERVAFIGWARPAQGGVPVCSEMQARYFSLLCSGEKRLPPPEDLRATIERDRRVEEDDYFIQSYMKTLVNYSVYLDAMAALIGCLPRFRDLWYRPALLMRFVFGTNIPSWYRLVGPHAEEALALENIRSMAMPFSVKRVIQFSWINLRLWLQSRVLGQELPYTLFN